MGRPAPTRRTEREAATAPPLPAPGPHPAFCLTPSSLSLQVLPAVYLAMGASLAATPAQLGAITLARALAQAVASPLAGALGDSCDRVRLVAAGCGLWATCTAGIALAGSLPLMLPLAALNGVGLALAIPCVQSIVADAVPAPARGSAFGVVGTAAGLGGMAAAWGATAAARASLFGGVPGWRVAFAAVAALSAGTGLAVLAFAEDPRTSGAAAIGGGGGEVALVSLSGSGGRQARGPFAASSTATAPPPSPRRLASGGLMKAASLASAGGSGGRFPWAGGTGPARDEEAALLPALPLLHASSATTPPASPRALTNGKEPGHALRPTVSLGSAAGILAAAEAAALSTTSAPTLGTALVVGLRRAGAAARAVLRVPSFRVLVAQGVVGSMPWQALLYSTLYLQLLGFPDATAGGLSAAFAAACAAGGLLGGALGDAAARVWPDGGRIAVSQVSVAAGLPLAWALLRGVPGSAACASASAATAASAAAGTGIFAGNTGPGASLVAPSPACGSAMAAIMVATGLLISWCGSNNSAIFADVVPAHLRSTVFAYDRAFEGAVAATATPLVGWLAVTVFGFQGSLADVGDGAAGKGGAASGGPSADGARARALGSALLLTTCVPWAACWLAYLALYRAYPPDARRAARAAARLAAVAVPVSSAFVTPPASPRPPLAAPAGLNVNLSPTGPRSVAAAAEEGDGDGYPPTPRLVTLEDAYALVMQRKADEAAAARESPGGSPSGGGGAAGGAPAAAALAPPRTPPPLVTLGSGGASGGAQLHHSRPLSRSGASLPRTPVRRGGSGGGGGAWGGAGAGGGGATSSIPPPGAAGLNRAPSAPAPDGPWNGGGVASPRPGAGRRRSLDLLRRF